MKLLSIEALGGDQYRAVFDDGTYDVEVTDYMGIRGVSSKDRAFWELLNPPVWDQEIKKMIAGEVSLLIHEALKLNGVGTFRAGSDELVPDVPIPE